MIDSMAGQDSVTGTVVMLEAMLQAKMRVAGEEAAC
jgi:hypothetical protein